MYSLAQQEYLVLRKNGLNAAVFEGAWYVEKGLVFELGQKYSLKDAEAAGRSVAGFKTYEGEEFFYEIIKTHEFAQNLDVLANTEASRASNVVHMPDAQSYAQKIAEIQELIKAGETYQVNYSVPFAVHAPGKDPFEIYCALTRINPSPYMCFIQTDEGALISNSPECLMQLSADGTLKTVPIKGTLPRGKSAQEDAANEAQLLASEKNKAELAMIVDLERNDLGKVCTPATVRVQRTETGDFRIIEKYSHVMHTVAHVEGQLEKNKTWHDAFEALFPGGSVTGCPKIRTMEIIKKLEDGPRGIYCGSAGYAVGERARECLWATAIPNAPRAVFNILIRSLWFDKKTDTITFRSGGGIVADSTAQEEYTELMHKAAAIVGALTL